MSPTQALLPQGGTALKTGTAIVTTRVRQFDNVPAYSTLVCAECLRLANRIARHGDLFLPP